MSDLRSYSDTLGISFKDMTLLEEALTHRSYLNEYKDAKRHNERLEFLGDAVLQLAAAHFLYGKFPDTAEGQLTPYRAALVNWVTLSEAAASLNMNDMIRLSRGEQRGSDRARQIILADAFEAVLGAIYLDQGYVAAEAFLAKNLFSKLDSIIERGAYQDAKSKFQEAAQEKKSITPIYKILKEEGPDHDKEFTVGVYVGEDEVARGAGKSKQEAEQSAAKAALDKSGW